MKGGGFRTRRILRGWASAAGLLLLLHIVLLGAYALLDELRLLTPTTAMVLAGVFVVALAVVMVLCFRIIGFGHLPREEREARAAGLPATARVLAVQQTRWRLDRNTNFKLETTPRRWEYRIFLRVMRPGEPDYEAEVAEFLLSDQVPRKGDVLDIKVHPRDPDWIAWTPTSAQQRP